MPEMNDESKLRELFSEYAAFDKLDFKKQAEFFADNFMVGPKGVTSQSKQAFLESAGEGC